MCDHVFWREWLVGWFASPPQNLPHHPIVRGLWAAHKGQQNFWRGAESSAPAPELCLHHCEGGCKGKKFLPSFGQTSWPQYQSLSIVSAFIWRKRKYLSLGYHQLCRRIWHKLKYLEERWSFLRLGKNPWLGVYFTFSIWCQGQN